MPAWIHDRAKRIQSSNPDMPESEAWAIATQQSHATGHTPKSYGTKQGRKVAKMKYDDPKDTYQKTAMWSGFFDEMQKIALKPNAVEGLKLMRNTSTWKTMPEMMKQPLINHQRGQQLSREIAAGISSKPVDPSKLSWLPKPLEAGIPKSSAANPATLREAAEQVARRAWSRKHKEKDSIGMPGAGGPGDMGGSPGNASGTTQPQPMSSGANQDQGPGGVM